MVEIVVPRNILIDPVLCGNMRKGTSNSTKIQLSTILILHNFGINIVTQRTTTSAKHIYYQFKIHNNMPKLNQFLKPFAQSQLSIHQRKIKWCLI